MNNLLFIQKYVSMQVRASSVLFVDNPVGTGYSYTDTEDALTKDVAMVASDMMVLLKNFFSLKTEFQVSKTKIPTRLNLYSSHSSYYLTFLPNRAFPSIYFRSLTEAKWQQLFPSSSQRYWNVCSHFRLHERQFCTTHNTFIKLFKSCASVISSIRGRAWDRLVPQK